MDFIFCGVIDIVIVVSFIIILIVGFKKGFVEKFLNLANGLCGFLFSLIFCRDFASFLIKHNIFYGGIYNKVFENVSSAEVLQDGTATAEEILNALGLPQNISEFIASNLQIDTGQIAVSISTTVSEWIMVVIGFLCLFIGTSILCFFLKIIFKAFKEGSTLLKITDGILGVIFYSVIYFAIIYVVLFGVSIFMQTTALESVRNFIDIDMQLSTDEFRLSKYLYDNNVLANLIGVFI